MVASRGLRTYRKTAETKLIKQNFPKEKRSEIAQIKVIYTPKVGKSSQTSPKDFRSISLSSFLLKTLKRRID